MKNLEIPTSRSDLYPEIAPYRSGFLRVSALHQIYFEESGNPAGKPVVFLHGGPGSGTEPMHRRFFNPARYRIILFDQRGCGRSTPHAELQENTTWDLVADIESLRRHLEIDRWQVFGGSWGSTLALLYAQAYPTRVTELIVRGIFLFLKEELDWFYQDGASALFPDAWADFAAHIPQEERGDLVRAYHQRLTAPDPGVRQAAAQAWSLWEGRTSRLLPDSALLAKVGEEHVALALARIECHYMHHMGFLRQPNQVLGEMPRIAHIPGVIVHGRYDVVCPARSAWQLHRAWQRADLRLVADAGHSAMEPGIIHELVSATDRFAPLS